MEKESALKVWFEQLFKRTKPRPVIYVDEHNHDGYVSFSFPFADRGELYYRRSSLDPTAKKNDEEQVVW